MKNILKFLKNKILYIIGILIITFNIILFNMSDNTPQLYDLVNYNYVSAPKDFLFSRNDKNLIFYNYDKDVNRESISYEMNDIIISYVLIDDIITEFRLKIPENIIKNKNIIKFFNRNYSKLNKDNICYIDDFFMWEIESDENNTLIKAHKIKYDGR